MAIKIRLFANIPDEAQAVVQSVVQSLSEGISVLSVCEVDDLEEAVTRIADGEGWRHGDGAIIVVPNVTTEEVTAVQSFVADYKQRGGRAWIDVQVFDLQFFGNAE